VYSRAHDGADADAAGLGTHGDGVAGCFQVYDQAVAGIQVSILPEQRIRTAHSAPPGCFKIAD